MFLPSSQQHGVSRAFLQLADVGTACSASTDTGASLSAALGKLTVTCELSNSHCIRSATELSFMIQDFHYTYGAEFRFCTINRIPVFSKSIETGKAGTQLPGLLLDI